MEAAAQDEKPGRVAYQGAPGAFSHEACSALRPWDEAVAFETFQDAIAALKSGDCDCALIPVENSSIGAVEPAATLVRNSGLTVVAEAWRPIRHALMGVDGARLSDVRSVLSHPIALAQCEQNLKALRLNADQALELAFLVAERLKSGRISRSEAA